MGMEGKLRQVSEFELALYRKSPAKLYSDLVGKHRSESYSKLTSIMRELQESPIYCRVQERAMTGQAPLQEDLDALEKHQDKLLKENQGIIEDLQSDMMGLSKDGAQLSLYKDWHILHYVLTRAEILAGASHGA